LLTGHIPYSTWEQGSFIQWAKWADAPIKSDVSFTVQQNHINSSALMPIENEVLELMNFTVSLVILRKSAPGRRSVPICSIKI
jgi:hypothetical protein